jgi:hypothetical protein
MSNFNDKRVPDDLHDVVDRLHHERPEASAPELDRIKLRAMRGARGFKPGKGQLMRSKLVGVMLAVGILAGGTGAMAVTGSGPSNVFHKTHKAHKKHHARSSVNSQYCPPKSPQAGKPKKPRPARCGKGPKP